MINNIQDLHQLLKPVLSGKETPDELIKIIKTTNIDLTGEPLKDKGDGRQFLHFAVMWNVYDLVVALIEKGIDPNSRDSVNQKTPLHYLVTKKDGVKTTPKIIDYLIAQGADINAVDKYGHTPLTNLLDEMEGDTDEERVPKEKLAEYLIELATPIQGDWGYLALSAALFSPYIFEKLLSKGLDINGLVSSRHPISKTVPILTALYDDQNEVVKWLLEKGINLNNEIGNLCYCVANDKNNHEAIDLLMTHGVDSSVKIQIDWLQKIYFLIRREPRKLKDITTILDEEKIQIELPPYKSLSTILHYACYFGYTEAIQEFIDRGANVNARNEEGSTPLHELMRTPNPIAVSLLLDAGADINSKNYEGFTPIQKLGLSEYTPEDLKKDTIVALEVFLKRGADISGDIGLSTLCQFSTSIEAARALIEKDILLHSDRYQPISRIAADGNSELYFLLISKGVNVEPIAYNILYSTIKRNGKNAERYQIASHCLPFLKDVNQIDPEVNSTLLNSCASYDQGEIAALLIKRGANIDHRNKQERTPLQQALIYDSNIAAKVLVEGGANIDGLTGVSYLNQAISNKNIINTKLLIDAGVDVNQATDSTPLQTAIKQSHVPIVKLLLEKGANPNIKSEKEKYPLAIAIKKGHELITHLLLLNGADVNLPYDKKSNIKDLAMKSKNAAIASMVQLSPEELKQFKPHQKLLRFVNKRELFAEGEENWTDAIKSQIKANFGKRTLDSIKSDTGEIEYFDVVDESGKGQYQLMLFNYGDGCLFNYGKKTVIGNIVQHGFDLEKKLSEEAELELREMLDDAYRSFDGSIKQMVGFLDD
jgi:ankyrin repeat protein